MPMKESFFIKAVIGLLAMATLFGTARAAGPPGGNFAGKGVGFRTVCFTGSTRAACSAASSTAVPYNDAIVSQGVAGASGQFCFTATDVLSPVAGSKAQAQVSDWIGGGSTTQFNPVTERGTVDLTLFDVADGVSCNDPTLVNPNGAQPIGTSTLDFAVSQGGNRIDFVFTTLKDSGGTIGSTVLSFSADKQ